jgi:hypothetical protein
LVILMPTNSRFVPSSIVTLLSYARYHTRLETTNSARNDIDIPNLPWPPFVMPARFDKT